MTKKIGLLTFVFILTFSLTGLVLGMAPEHAQRPQGDDSDVVRRTRGIDQAMERVRENLERIEEETGRNVRGLERAIERLMLRRGDFCYQIEEDLEYGDEENDVGRLQSMLREEGFYRGEIDDLYGWSTAEALYNFQNDNEIELEGLERFGFVLSDQAKDLLNERFECDPEDEEEENDIDRLELLISSTDGGTTDPDPETYQYEEGEEVTVEAISDEGYEFEGWEKRGSATECDSEDKKCVFEIKEDSTLAAHFVAVEEDVVYSCEEDADCQWVSTNCCPETAGANWECVNEAETELDCPENPICLDVQSPKPTSSCECADGECREEDGQ